jgi:hypothetical protein
MADKVVICKSNRRMVAAAMSDNLGQKQIPGIFHHGFAGANSPREVLKFSAFSQGWFKS